MTSSDFEALSLIPCWAASENALPKVCDSCARSNSSVLFTSSGYLEIVKIHLCAACILAAPVKVREALFLPATEFKVYSSDPETFLENLSVAFPAFTRRLSGFLHGKLEGAPTERVSFLQSIADRVTASKSPPTREQADAFVRVFDSLVSEKSHHGVIRPAPVYTADERKSLASKYITIANDNLHLFNDKAKEVIKSMTTQYRRRFSLTDKQISYLKSIVEKLPDSVLAKYR
jgi:hypothetical protein